MTDLAAELFKLWRAGEVALPTVAAVYGETAQAIHATSASDGAFSGGQGSGSFAGAWANMRALFQDQVLGVTANNLVDIGDALKIIATNYSQDDSATADAFEESIKNLPYSGLDQPPPYIPRPPAHDEPPPINYNPER